MATDIPELGILPVGGAGWTELTGPLELPDGVAELSGTFCWTRNPEPFISALSEEVTALGLAPLQGEGGLDLLALVNGTSALLQLYREASAQLGTSEAAELRRAGELDYLRGRQSKLKAQVEACEREIAAVQGKEQQLQSENKELLALLKREKDEVVKLLATLASRGAQHRHELRRKEQELSRLKEKMSQQLAEKRDRRATLEILNSLGRADGRRATWKTGKSLGKKEEEMFRSLLTAQEKQLQELMLENAALKQLLAQLCQDMGALLGEDGGTAQGAQGEPGTGPSDGMGEQLTPSVREKWRSLKSHVESLGSQAAAGSQGPEGEAHALCGTDHDKEILKLKAELEESQRLVALQQQCFQEQLIAAANSELPANLRGSYFLEEQQRLQEEQEAFQQQKRAFEVERCNFTEAAIRLGHERQRFEEERALFLKRHFLVTMAGLEPPDLGRRLSAPLAAREQELLPKQVRWIQPTYTPYPKAKTPAMLVRSRHLSPHPGTPSTAELFRVLKLIPDRGSTQPSLQSNDQKESHKDTACQTESEDFWPMCGDLLDHFLDSSF
ncbi:afadin- and alpha-actinin-binding protein-like isoform X2 [Pelodiscus sinensis]|uniref:afadin- and alpha-actinin-binding protein-like isoform X2 n=1 Tax=Pelodiscus sinensis TaxID=13735 RepID=UPI003F6AD8B3